MANLQRKAVRALKQKGALVALVSVAYFGAADGTGRCDDEPSLARHEASLSVMGSAFTVAAYGEDRGRLASAVRAAFDEARRIDDLLSNYKPASELSFINEHAGRGPVQISAEMAQFLSQCLAYSRLSAGGFDITVGPLMETWGFFKGSGRLPGKWALSRARGKVGFQFVELDPTKQTVRFMRAGMRLDPGGIGKGYAVDRMAAILREARIERAFISAGRSSMYGLGSPPNQADGWPVRIRSPKESEGTAAEVHLKNRSLSTSGFYEKFFEADGKIYSHIMDPRTGMPAEEVLTVSVISAQTIDSEAWATGFYVNGVEWTRQHKPAEFRVLLCSDQDACEWIGEAGVLP